MFPQRRFVFVQKSPVFLFSVLALSNVSMWPGAQSPATYKQNPNVYEKSPSTRNRRSYRE